MKSIYHIHVAQEHLDAGQPVISGAPNSCGADKHRRQNHQWRRL